MSKDLKDKRLGLVLGSWIADSLSLGAHWIYDTDQIAAKFGYVDQFYAPGADSYHPQKQAGELGHVGDQSLTLANYLAREHTWDAKGFMKDWLNMWDGYGDYFDHATKSTLANYESYASLPDSGSDSNELAGPARIAPLIAFLSHETEEKVVEAAVQQTVLTHNSPATIEAATFLAQASHRLMHGAELLSTIQATAPSHFLQKAEAVIEFDPVEAIAQIGQSCSTKNALPAVLYLALKHGNDLPKAFSENAIAGGDNCVRGLALGMILGAYHGANALPDKWQQDLKLEGVSQFLQSL